MSAWMGRHRGDQPIATYQLLFSATEITMAASHRGQRAFIEVNEVGQA